MVEIKTQGSSANRRESTRKHKGRVNVPRRSSYHSHGVIHTVKDYEQHRPATTLLVATERTAVVPKQDSVKLEGVL